MENRTVNSYKTEIMQGFRFCQRVYEGGIETPEQFDVFTNLCENHVNNCNAICKKIKPKLGIIQYKKYMQYKDFRYTCAYTVNYLNNILSSIQAEYDKAKEIAELQEQLEIKSRIEFELAMEFKEIEQQRQIERRKTKPIGFNVSQEIDEDYFDEEFED